MYIKLFINILNIYYSWYFVFFFVYEHIDEFQSVIFGEINRKWVELRVFFFFWPPVLLLDEGKPERKLNSKEKSSWMIGPSCENWTDELKNKTKGHTRCTWAVYRTSVAHVSRVGLDHLIPYSIGLFFLSKEKSLVSYCKANLW